MVDAKVEEKARELADMIRSSEEYRNYLLCRDLLKGDPQLYQRVNDYRKRNFLLQLEGNPANLYDEMGQLWERFEPERRDIRVSGFLQYEHSLCRMVQQVEEILLENLDFDIEFLEEEG